MPDRDKVIKEFEHLLNEAKGDYMEFADLTVDFGEEILALLKEQEPKPVLSERTSDTGAFRREKKGFCPHCHQEVRWELNRSYCGFCGQEVKWNDESRSHSDFE